MNTGGNKVGDIHDAIASNARRLHHSLMNRFDIAIMSIISVSLIIALHDKYERSWPWALIAASAIVLAVYHKNLSDHAPHRIQVTSDAVQDIHDHAKKNTIGISPDEETKLFPDLYNIGQLKDDTHRWIRGDPNLVAALNTLRPFSYHDSHRVRLILQLLGEFYRRYVRVLNRPHTVHVRHEYTILHDLHLRVLNTVHELYFTKPLVLCANLEVVIRAIQARTYRMLRVLRHKYPTELRAIDVEKGSAPRSYDHSWTSYDLFV